MGPPAAPNLTKIAHFWRPCVDQNGPSRRSTFGQNRASGRPKNGQNPRKSAVPGPKLADSAARNLPRPSRSEPPAAVPQVHNRANVGWAEYLRMQQKRKERISAELDTLGARQEEFQAETRTREEAFTQNMLKSDTQMKTKLEQQQALWNQIEAAEAELVRLTEEHTETVRTRLALIAERREQEVWILGSFVSLGTGIMDGPHYNRRLGGNRRRLGGNRRRLGGNRRRLGGNRRRLRGNRRRLRGNRRRLRGNRRRLRGKVNTLFVLSVCTANACSPAACPSCFVHPDALTDGGWCLTHGS